MGRCFLSQELLVSIEHDVQVELLLQQHQPMMTKALDGAHGCNLAHSAPQNVEHVNQVYLTGDVKREMCCSTERCVMTGPCIQPECTCCNFYGTIQFV